MNTIINKVEQKLSKAFGTDADMAKLTTATLLGVKSGQITLDQWEGFNNLSKDDREARFGNLKKLKYSKSRNANSDADEEKILEGNRQFLTDTSVGWYNKTDAEKYHQSLKIVSPKDIDWMSLKDDMDKDKFGEYTMNLDTAGIDWERIPPEKIKIFNFSEFVDRPRWELAKHLAENYSDQYHIPGIEYWKYLIENEDKIPKELKDGNYYYFFGSILRDQDGDWGVPVFGWSGGRWDRNAGWLEGDWSSNDRVLLLEK